MNYSYSIPINKPELKHLILTSPFKSKNKVKSILKRDYNVDATNHFIDKYIPSVPKYDKKEAKKFHYKTYSMPGGFIGDIFFSLGRKVAFLLLIEINTRKAYAYLLNNIDTKEIIDVDNEVYERTVDIETKKIKTTRSLMNAFDKFIIDVKGDITSLRFDGEAGINSKVFQNYLKQYKITFIPTRPKQHSSLSLIDRLCRTLRDMSYLMNVDIIDQSIMNIVLNYYNNSPHKTLTKFFFRLIPKLKEYHPYGISPNDVTKDFEKLYIKECYKYNMLLKSESDLDWKEPIYCYLVEDKDKLTKSRSPISRDVYLIIGKEGNMYKLMDKNNNIKYAPRYKLII